MNVSSYQKAKNLFLSMDYSVADYFKLNNYLLEYGYCKLLTGDIETAKVEFSKIKNRDIRANWCCKLIQFIEGCVMNVPSYFQIRNFLEIDLNLLIKSGQADFVENIINGVDIFYSINPESYKFIARVMLNNDFDDIAFYYLKKAKDKFYYDPEMHFLLAIYYAKKQEILSAKKSIKSCLNILPEYTPAKNLLARLK